MRWYQLLKEAVFAKEGEHYAPVTLPHIWNAMDGQESGGDFWRGVGPKLFTIAGPVIVYGVSASVVYGLIYWIWTMM